MDFTGTLLGALTIPMILLNAGCGLAGFWLIIRGDWFAVLIGVVLVIIGAIAAPLLSRAAKTLAVIAAIMKVRDARSLSYSAAALSSALPILLIVAWEVAILFLFEQRNGDDDGIAIWLWSYGVATGVWSWHAHRADNEDRTLRGIQAYSGQLAYVILAGGMILLGWPLPLAIALMLLPMILPLIVGILLALADQDALRDVRI